LIRQHPPGAVPAAGGLVVERLRSGVGRRSESGIGDTMVR
jgi:hypothetical protein